MAQLQMLYSEWLDQDLVGRIQIKSPPTLYRPGNISTLTLEDNNLKNTVITIKVKVQIIKKHAQMLTFKSLCPPPPPGV